jgi:hypothetical protein
MATSAERMRALRERRRRGFHKLTIQVSEHDLRQIAQAGYEGSPFVVGKFIAHDSKLPILGA